MRKPLARSLLLTLAGFVWVVGLSCRYIADFPDPPRPIRHEVRCTAQVINDAGWVEAVASDDADLCTALGGCRRLFNFCEYGGASAADPAVLHAEWQRVIAEAVGTGTFRGQPGPWCVSGARCEEIATFEGDEAELPACAASVGVAFAECAADAGCLAVSQGSIDFGEQGTGSTGAARFVEVSNACPEAIQLAADGRITCDDSRQCRACEPGDSECVPDFRVATDCLPLPGEESRTLDGTLSPDPRTRRCSLGLELQPQERGTRRARKVLATEGGETLSVHLQGVGVGGTSQLTGPTEICRDSSFLIADPPCTRPGDNLHLELANLGPTGALRIDDVQLPEGTGFYLVQTYRTAEGSDEEIATPLPHLLSQSQVFHVIVRWCANRSPGAGALDEAVNLVISTDDPVNGPSSTVLLRWSATGCS
ncbi:MAG TPA: hypothetical protein VF017_08315 [Thermoanaerobaculia bacterium]|nr:hypothetical protein [Thermoanaerobaculia bacterium]